jgi:hypothetical protein
VRLLAVKASGDLYDDPHQQHQMARRKGKAVDVLDEGYRRAVAVAHINGVIEDAGADAKRRADEALIPKNLKLQLRKAMKERPEDAWDKVLYRLAEDQQRGNQR